MRRLYVLLFCILFVGLIAKPCFSEEGEGFRVDGYEWKPWDESWKAIFLVSILSLCQTAIDSDDVVKNSSSQRLKKVVTCRFLKDGKPYDITTNFTVDDQIYVFASWQNVKGSHTVEAYWYGPGNRLRSVVPVSFESRTGYYNTWFWFKIGRADWEEFFDSTPVESVGIWHVAIYLDDKFIGKLNFTVG